MTILILLICHAFGDYYLQTGTLAKKKENDYAYIAIHCVVYAVPFAIICIVIHIINNKEVALNVTIASIVAVLVHFIVDTGKYYMQKKYSEYGSLIYIVDQFLHYITLILAARCFEADILEGFDDMDWSGNLLASLIWIMFLIYLVYLLQPSYITYKVVVKRNFKIDPAPYIEDDWKFYMIAGSCLSILSFFFTKQAVIITAIYFIITSLVKNRKTANTMLHYEPFAIIGYICVIGLVLRAFLFLIMIIVA